MKLPPSPSSSFIMGEVKSEESPNSPLIKEEDTDVKNEFESGKPTTGRFDISSLSYCHVVIPLHMQSYHIFASFPVNLRSQKQCNILIRSEQSKLVLEPKKTLIHYCLLHADTF